MSSSKQSKISEELEEEIDNDSYQESITESDESESEKDDDNSYDSLDTLDETISTGYVTEDVSKFCQICQEFIYYGDLTGHRHLHKALEFLQIQSVTALNTKSLSKHRMKLIKLINNLPNVTKLKIQRKIDRSFNEINNFLIHERRLDKFPKYNLIKPLNPYNPTEKLDILASTEVLLKDSLDSIEISCSSNCREGSSTLFHWDIEHLGHIYGWVTAGNNGKSPAKKYFLKCFPKYLKESFESCLIYTEYFDKLSFAIKETCLKIDKELSFGFIDIKSFKSFSSCTFQCVIIKQQDSLPNQLPPLISTVNLGDGSIIRFDGINDFLIINKPNSTLTNPDEVTKIRDSGGYLQQLPTVESATSKYLLHGQSHLTRVLGGHGNVHLKLFQLAEPTIYHFSSPEDQQQLKGIVLMNGPMSQQLLDGEHNDIKELFFSEFPDYTRFGEVNFLAKDDSSETPSSEKGSIWDDSFNENQDQEYDEEQESYYTSMSYDDSCSNESLSSTLKYEYYNPKNKNIEAFRSQMESSLADIISKKLINATVLLNPAKSIVKSRNQTHQPMANNLACIVLLTELSNQNHQKHYNNNENDQSDSYTSS